MKNFPDWQKELWQDLPENPIVGYFDAQEQPKQAIGDPQVLLPGEADELWHMFYHGFYDTDFTPYYHHLTSLDGIHWNMKHKWRWDTNPSFIFHDGEKWILYFTQIISSEKEQNKYDGANMVISAKWSKDLEIWSDSVTLIKPELPWEREYCVEHESGKRIQVRNPCVVKLSDNRYRMYYSAGTVMLWNCGYEEPKYISCAEADNPFGPFEKLAEPLLKPDISNPYRNLGCGAIKVFGNGDEFIALYNPIYIDSENMPRSAISVLRSADGLSFEEAPYNPIILPQTSGWKKALVYQLDLVKWNGDLRLYYNARDEWGDGIERIGCSVLKNDKSDVHKLWDLSK